LLREPFTFPWRFRNERQNDREQGDSRNDAEVKLSQLLLVDTGGEPRKLVVVLLMTIRRHSMFADGFEQMRSIRGSNPLGGEMTTNVQISGILSLFDDLMMLFCFSHGVLLRMNAFGKTFVARFIVSTHLGDVLFDRSQLRLGRAQLLPHDPGRIR